MTSVTTPRPDLQDALTAVREHAAQVIARLYDRCAYVSDEEFNEIMSLVRALKQFCGAGQAG